MARTHMSPTLDLPALAELAAHRQWVCWKLGERDGKPTKLPMQPNGFAADTTKPHTWATFDECQAGVVKHKFNGIGFVFRDGQGLVGIDLDKCRDPATGTIEPWASTIIDRVRSYTEVSQSGTGVHIIARGRIPRLGSRRGQVECYAGERYFIVTGDLLEGCVDEIVEADEAVEWLWTTHIRRAVDAPQEPVLTVEPSEFPVDKFDALVTNDDRFRHSWRHKRQDLADQSLSSYDAALCFAAASAGWTDGELAALIIAHRNKWGGAEKAHRRDYLARTIMMVREAVRSRMQGTESERSAMGRVLTKVQAEETLDGGPAEALAELRGRLGIPIERVIITGEREARAWSIVLEDGYRFSIGDSASLLSQAAMRAALLSHCQVVLPACKAPVWDATISILQAASEREDSADSDPLREVGEAIQRYSAEAPPWDGELGEAEFRECHPIKSRDGQTLVNVGDFAKWCSINHTLAGMNAEKIRGILRSGGWKGKAISRKIDGKVYNFTYWGKHE